MQNERKTRRLMPALRRMVAGLIIMAVPNAAYAQDGTDLVEIKPEESPMKLVIKPLPDRPEKAVQAVIAPPKAPTAKAPASTAKRKKRR